MKFAFSKHIYFEILANLTLLIFMSCNQSGDKIAVSINNDTSKSENVKSNYSKSNDINKRYFDYSAAKLFLNDKNDSTLFNSFISHIDETNSELVLESGCCSEICDSVNYMKSNNGENLTGRVIGLTYKYNNELNALKRLFINIKLKPMFSPKIIRSEKKGERAKIVFRQRDYYPFDTTEQNYLLISVNNKIKYKNGKIIVLNVSESTGVPAQDAGGFLISFYPNGKSIDCIEWYKSSCSEFSTSTIDKNKQFNLKYVECENIFVNENLNSTKEYRLSYSIKINDSGKFVMLKKELKEINK